MNAGRMQIGEVAERVGLSLRTIRHYEEVGLVRPSGRSKGGFRLYTEDDVQRLARIKRMKPLEFSLEEMRDLLTVMTALADPSTPPTRRAALTETLEGYLAAAESRVTALREQLQIAEGFAEDLRCHRRRHARPHRCPVPDAGAVRPVPDAGAVRDGGPGGCVAVRTCGEGVDQAQELDG
jgi:MerR family copper efflux transcriptional regulator